MNTLRPQAPPRSRLSGAATVLAVALLSACTGHISQEAPGNETAAGHSAGLPEPAPAPAVEEDLAEREVDAQENARVGAAVSGKIVAPDGDTSQALYHLQAPAAPSAQAFYETHKRLMSM